MRVCTVEWLCRSTKFNQENSLTMAILVFCSVLRPRPGTYFVPAPWLSVKLLRLLQNYPPPEDPGVRGRLNECLETILNKAQEPPKSKKVQHSNAKNSVLFEAISLIIHNDRYGSLNNISNNATRTTCI